MAVCLIGVCHGNFVPGENQSAVFSARFAETESHRSLNKTDCLWRQATNSRYWSGSVFMMRASVSRKMWGLLRLLNRHSSSSR